LHVSDERRRRIADGQVGMTQTRNFNNRFAPPPFIDERVRRSRIGEFK